MANKFRLSSDNQVVDTQPWSAEPDLKQALADRERFLSAHPGYIPYQREIDAILDKAGNPQNRLAVFALMLECKLGELKDKTRQMLRILEAKTA